MKKQIKLFENVNGNQFRLLTESITEANQADLVRGGLKKVFGAGDSKIPYLRLENVGLGYIKDVNEAKKCALQESKNIAPFFGYKANDSKREFVKEDMDVPDSHSESDMTNPEETREVQMIKGIQRCLDTIKQVSPKFSNPTVESELSNIQLYVYDLLKRHNEKG